MALLPVQSFSSVENTKLRLAELLDKMFFDLCAILNQVNIQNILELQEKDVKASQITIDCWQLVFSLGFQQVSASLRPGGGVLPEKLGGGVQPTSQNLYPNYDQNLHFLLPYL